MRWTEWEQPWTRADGCLGEYAPMTGNPQPGDVVALRQRSKPYLPTFAPWWAGLLVSSVDGDEVRFANQPQMVAQLSEYPIETHWAIAKSSEAA